MLIDDALSIDADASVSPSLYQSVLRGDSFLVTGTAINIKKFKVTADGGYEVALFLEGAHEEVPLVPVILHSDLCARFLGQSAAECAAYLQAFSKKEYKRAKIEICLRFTEFRGCFQARLVSGTGSGSGSIGGTGTTDGPSAISGDGPTSGDNVDAASTNISPSQSRSIVLLDYWNSDT
jgi:hypothetical protein